ncbi:MAG: hypothetical protein ACYDG4_15200 [Desulfuromonadaceae bacterium]
MNMKWIALVIGMLILTSSALAVVVYPGGTFKGPVNMYGYNVSNATNIEYLETVLPANVTRIASLEGNDTVHDAGISDLVVDLGANATKADNALAWIALNETAISDVAGDVAANATQIDNVESWLGTNVSYLGTNATKADNALAWLVLNDTRIDDVVVDVGANDSRVTALEEYVPHLNVITGGAAGDHTLTGIATGDELVGVLYVAKGAENLTAVTDVGTEFSINATADRISNWAGTNTTGGYLLAAWGHKTA